MRCISLRPVIMPVENIPPKKAAEKREIFQANNSFGKEKQPHAVALAVIFGLVAGVVFQGVNIAADKYRGNDSSTTIGKTETVPDRGQY